jgi:hypothetical protein
VNLCLQVGCIAARDVVGRVMLACLQESEMTL